MARLRFNNVDWFGGANPISLTAGGTTAIWQSPPPFPTITAPDYAVIEVEPGTTHAEILYLTGYLSGSTTATVVRNAEATNGGQNSAAAHTNVRWTHGPTDADFVNDATATTKGVVRLAGDLGGTATAPTVPGLALLAPKASPAFTGTPTAPTATPLDNSTKIASTAYADAAVAVETSRAVAAEAAAEKTANKGQPGGYAALDSGGRVPRSQLPNITSVSTVQVGSQAAMLALPAPDPDTSLQAVRADTPGTVYWLNPGLSPAVLANWVQIADDISGAASAAQAAAEAFATSAVGIETSRATSAEATLSAGVAGAAQPLTRIAVTGATAAGLGGLYALDTTGGTFTVTLPAANGGKGRIVLKWVAGTVAPSIALTGTDHINTSTGPTSATFSLGVNQGFLFESDGAGIWTVTADDLPLSALDNRYYLTLGPSNGLDDTAAIQAAVTAAGIIAAAGGVGAKAIVRGMPGVTYQVTYSGPLSPLPVVGSCYPAIVMAANVILESVGFNAPDWGTPPHLTNNVAVITAATGVNGWGVRLCTFVGNAPSGLGGEYPHYAIEYGNCSDVTIEKNTISRFRSAGIQGFSVGFNVASTTLTKGSVSPASLTVTALTLAIPANGSIAVNDQSGNTQVFAVPGGAAAGSTTVNITSATVTVNSGSTYWVWGTTWPPSYNRIDDNTITLCMGGAIKLANGFTDLWITRNRCTDNLGIVSGTYTGAECVFINDYAGINARFHIKDNHIANWGSCIVLGSGSQIDIAGNYLSPPPGGNCFGIEDTANPLGGVVSLMDIHDNFMLGATNNVAVSLGGGGTQNCRVHDNMFVGQYINPVFINEASIATGNAYFNNTLTVSPLGSGVPRVIIHAGSTSQAHMIGTLQVGSSASGGQTTMLPPGASGTVLTSGGPSSIPTWAAGTPGPASWAPLAAWNSATSTYTSNAPSGPASLVLRGQYTYVANAVTIPAGTDPAAETTVVGGIGAHWTCVAGPGPQGATGPPGAGTTFPYGMLAGAPTLIAGNDGVPYYAQDTQGLYQVQNVAGTETLVPIGVFTYNGRQGPVTSQASDLVGLIPPAPAVITAATLSSGLVTGVAITSVPINALPYPAKSGNTFLITDGAGHSQTVTLSAPAAVGATTLTVNSVTPNFAYPSGTYLVPTSLSITVPAGAGHVKVSLVGGGGGGGGGGSMGVATVSTTLTNGAPSGTTLTVTALPQAIASGATITVNDGAGHTQAFTTTATAAAGAVSVSITSATVTLNTGSGYSCWGSAWAQVGGSGGGAGAFAQGIAAVIPAAVLTLTAGGVLAAPGAGAAAAMTNAGVAGGAGGNGSSVTLTGTGVSVTAPGGKGGAGGPANSVAATVGGYYGGQASNLFAASNGLPGSGGSALSTNGYAGGPPVGLSPRGGGAGGPANGSTGGVGGGAATVGVGGSGTSSGTSSANPTTPGQGGDGGGGGAAGGAGAAGTTGTPPQALIEWLS